MFLEQEGACRDQGSADVLPRGGPHATLTLPGLLAALLLATELNLRDIAVLLVDTVRRSIIMSSRVYC